MSVPTTPIPPLNAQTLFMQRADELESLLDLREKEVRAAMAHYMATGVSEQYQGVEQKWLAAAREVRTIIRTCRQSLVQNDQSADTALKQAGSAVANII